VVAKLLGEITVGKCGTAYLIGARPYSREIMLDFDRFMLVIEPDNSAWWLPICDDVEPQVVDISYRGNECSRG
jgi:hypothetical protein